MKINSLKNQKYGPLIYTCPDKASKDTGMNRALPSLPGGSFEIRGARATFVYGSNKNVYNPCYSFCGF